MRVPNRRYSEDTAAAVEYSPMVQRARSLCAQARDARQEAAAMRKRSQLSRIQRQIPKLGNKAVHLPVGYERSTHECVSTNHAIDGDGASVCGRVDRGLLTPIAGLSWYDVPGIVACPHCSYVMSPDPAVRDPQPPPARM